MCGSELPRTVIGEKALRGNRRVSFGTFSLTLMRPPVVRRSNPSLRAAFRLALLFAAIKLLLQFTLTLWTQHIGYSYFRDEFYYIACGRHLAWGFVDHGPIVALQARFGTPLRRLSIRHPHS